MAISFAHVSIHSRTNGHSAVAAAAYRAGIKLYDERLGKNHDYQNRKDVQFTEILLPEGADTKFLERSFLWNEAERAENRKNSQVSKDFVLALPKELDLIQQIELAIRFAKVHFVDKGVPADIAIHDHGDGNPHAHILIPTRRIKGDRFDTHKARDLNPTFGRGYIKEEDDWHEKWRDFQDDFFEELGVNTRVDFDHVIAEKHQGSHRFSEDNSIQQDNTLIKQARQEIALNDVDNFINLVSIEHSVFTRRDLEKLLFKTIEKENYNEFFQITVERIFSNKNVICLGENEQHEPAYTTRNQFTQESALLKNLEEMHARQGHIFNVDRELYLEKTTLNEEQKQAFEFLASGGDVACIIGRPGVGKSYMLAPVNDFYQAQGCRVLGASLSGKVAKQLQTDAGIESSTIASLTARLLSGRLALTAKDILIIDEAGMVDFANLSFLVNKAREASAKLILVGDPDQLKPIKKGAIFKGIAARIGSFSMIDIKRQRHAGDRNASIALAQGKVQEALSHYHEKKALFIADSSTDESASDRALDSWQRTIQASDDLKNSIILAHANTTIEDLNQGARALLLKKGLLDANSALFVREKKQETTQLACGQRITITHTDNALGLVGGASGCVVSVSKSTIKIRLQDERIINVPAHLKRYIEPTRQHDFSIAAGERVLFKKGDQKIGVKNGDIGSVISIKGAEFTARLDSGEVITVPKRYKALDYAYAMTVHKSQGLSVDNTFVCVDTQWWDRALSFVAFTRHKEKLEIFTNSCHYPTVKSLVKQLSKQSLADNVIDYPLSAGQRQGFGVEGLIEQAVFHLTSASKAIKERASYLYNYVKLLTHEKNPVAAKERTDAQDIATYIDMKAAISQQHDRLKIEAHAAGKEISTLDAFSDFYQLACKRDEKAAALLETNSPVLLKTDMPYINKDAIKKEAERYTLVTCIKKVLRLKDTNPDRQPELAKTLSGIDMDNPKSALVVTYFAKQNNQNAEAIVATIRVYQKHYRRKLLNALKQQYPTLNEYTHQIKKRNEARFDYEKARIDKKLSALGRDIAADKSLSAQIRKYLPKLRIHINKNIQRGMEQERGIEH